MKALPQVSRDLLEAARIVERGWCQKMRVSDDGRVCAIGAIEAVVGGDSNRRLYAVCAVNQVIPKYTGLVIWNDAPERTQAEVVKALQDAALKAGSTKG